MELSDGGRTLAAILVLSLVTVETGGLYLVRLARGGDATTEFQRAFARAGHAHAGVLLILALVVLLVIEAAGAAGGALGQVARVGVPAAALLMPAGFFFSSMHAGATAPSRWVALVYVGAVSLAAGLTTAGVALLTA